MLGESNSCRIIPSRPRFKGARKKSHLGIKELSKKIPSEDETAALYLDGEVTECSNHETDSGTDAEDNTKFTKSIAIQTRAKIIHQNSNRYHPSIQPLILLYHKK
ncbi:hypothetical protein AVEN_123115-1 [Araneus ventricosus]|uniref:Uncharacterized protein n=1 Tax=Araneus ventricosus TaxID=182803 RepID=A0A4Y2M5Q8_ARAVE|nr:hypothetical protein AVEN_123115-1 [Araneus ventricosus]